MADGTRPTDQPAQATHDAGHHDAGPDDAVYDDDYRLANGLAGEALTIPSANPTNFRQVISDTAGMPRQDIWAKLFLPDGPGPFPVVIVVPGSLGLQPHHLAHASAIADAGIAACGLDPFGPRSVTSTVANQVQYSFAASAWDVLATAEVLAARPDILYAINAGYGVRGAHIGGTPELAPLFAEDMLTFGTAVMAPTR